MRSFILPDNVDESKIEAASGFSILNNTRESTMKELIKFIAQHLVDDPNKVQVLEIKGQNVSVIELRVAKNDMGKIIGKMGKTAAAMRLILSAVAVKGEKKAFLEIVE